MSHIALNLPNVCNYLVFYKKLNKLFLHPYSIYCFKNINESYHSFYFFFSLRQMHINMVLYAFYGEMIQTNKANIWVQRSNVDGGGVMAGGWAGVDLLVIYKTKML